MFQGRRSAGNRSSLRRFCRTVLVVAALASGLGARSAFCQTIELGYDEAVANATVQQGGTRSGTSGTNYFNMQNNANGSFASYGVAEWNLGAGSFLNAPAGLVGDDIGGLSVRMTQDNPSFSSDTPLRFWLWNNTTASIAPGSTDITFDSTAVGGISDPPQPWFSNPYSLWEIGTGNYAVTASGIQNTFTFDASVWDAAARDYVATQLNDSGLLRVVIESTLDTGANGSATYAGYTNTTYTGPELQLTVGGSIPTDTSAWWSADGTTLGGAGSWTAAGTNWSPTESPVAAGVWDPTTVATFAGTGGTVTVAEPLAVSGGISFTADGYTLSGGGLTLADAPGFAFTTINVAEAATATIDTPLAGAVTALRKTGTGMLSLGGTNTFTGPIRLQEGTLAVGSDAAFGDLANAVEFDGGTLAVPTSLDLGSRTLGGVGTGAGAGTIDIATGATLATAGSVNLGNLTLPGSGTLAVNGFSNVIGTVSATLTSGTARIEGAVDLGDSGGTWTVAAGGTLEIPGSLSSIGTLRKVGGGTLVLAGDNSSLELLRIGSQGTTPVDGGTVLVGNANALGVDDVQLNVGTIEATTPLEFANGLSIGGRANGAARFAGEAMTFAGVIGTFNPNGAVGDVTLLVDNETTFSGIVEATGTPLTIGGAGTLTMAALTTGLAVPVTLADSVTLQLANFSSLTPPLLTVGGSATLAGAGTVGSLTVEAGGTLSPGTSPGSILAGDTTLAAGGNYNFEIANAAGTAGFDWDLLDVTGTLTVAATPDDPFAVNLWSLASTNPDSSGDVPGFDNQAGYSWTFARATGGIADFAGDKFSVNTQAVNGTDGFANDLAGGSFSVAASGNDLNVVFTPFVLTPSLDWYGDGVSEGGSGTWSSLGSTWSPDGGSTIGTWDPQRRAIFGGTAGTVAIDAGGISAAAGLEFAADGYAVTGGTLTLAGATAADNAIEVASGQTATIAAPIAGTAGLTKAGTGTLLFSGANTYAGGTAITAGTLQVGDGTSGSISGDVTIQTGGRLVLNPAGSSSFAGGISGGGEVVKQGTGDLSLSGFSSHTGGTRIEGGSITASGFSALGSGAVTAVDGQLYVDGNASISNPITVGAGASGTPVLLAGWDFQTTTTGGTAIAAGPNTQTTLLANFGAGTISLDGANGSSAWNQATQLNAFSGTTENVGPGFSTVTSGAASLALVGSTANGQDAVFAIDMTGYGLLDVSYATRGTSTGFTSQNWSISTDGVTWQTVGSETGFSSTWTVRELATISGLADASTAYLRLSVDGATAGSGNNRLDNVQLVATPGGAVGTVVLGTQATSGTASFSSPIVLNQNVTLAAPTGGRADFSGVIADGVGQNGLTKTGGGIVALSGANTYAGATTVQEGTLLVNALNGPSAVTVASGATLGGSGTTGPLALAAGSTLAPGTQGPGTLSAGATTLGGGSYAFQIADASGLAGSGWDFLHIEGGLAVEATQASPYTIDLWTVSSGDTSGPAFGFDPLRPYRWTFLDTDSSLADLDLSAFAVNASATSTTGGFANDPQGGTFSIGVSTAGTGLDVIFTPDAATSSLVWYGDDAAPGGKGDWTALNVNWASGAILQTWEPGKTAVFDTVGGEVTIGPAGISAGNGIAFEATGYELTGGTLTLAGGTQLVNSVTVGDGLSATISAVVAGSAGLTKQGNGTLVLAADNLLTGGASVAAGTLQLGAGGTSGSLTGDIAIGTIGTLAVDRSDELTLAGGLTGGGGLVKRGTGTLVLTGSNTFAGGTTVADGTVVVGDGGTAGGIASDGDLDLAAATQLAFDRSDAIAFTGGVTGSGTLAQRGGGTLTLSRPTAYGSSFTLRVEEGTVNLDRSGATLVGILGAGNGVELAGGTLQLTSNGGPETKLEGAAIDVQASSTLAIARTGDANNHNTTGFSTPITVANESTLSFDYRGAITAGFSASTTYTAPVTLASDATFAVTNSAGGTAEVIFAGAVGDAAGGHGLVKAGPQQLTLAGVNTYAGGTTVSAGTLALGADGTIDSSPLVTVAAGATFDLSAKTAGYAVPATQTIAGAGTVAGTTILAAGATVAPGVPVGTLTTSGDVTFGGGGNYNWQVIDAAGTAGAAGGWDLLSVGGAIAITATSADPFTVNLWSLSAADPLTSGSAANFDATQAGTWRIASASGGITGFAADAFTVKVGPANGTAGFANAIGTGTFSVTLAGSDLNLVYAPGTPTSDIVIDVPSGSQTQGQAGYPSIATADSVTKIGAGTVVFDAANAYTGDTTVSAGTLEIANADAVAASAVTVASGATLSVASGTTMKSPSVTLDGGTLAADTLAVDAAAGIATLVINSGTVANTTGVVVGPGGLVGLPTEARVAVGVASLAIDETATGGLVDLGSGQITVASGGITAADLRADIIAGRNGGAWDGAGGITSSAAAGSGGTRAVGYTVAGDGVARVSFAAPGDTNLDGEVDLIDLLAILSSGTYDQPVPAVWGQGDFTYDGVTDLLDLLAILGSGTYDQGNYFPAAPASLGGVGTVAAVPEPGAAGATGLLAAAAAMVVIRRRGFRRAGSTAA